jgi:dihydroneopterin aldolase
MTIRVNDLEFKAIIGLLDFERDQVQRVRLTLEATYTYQSSSFLDYAQMVGIAKQHIIAKKYTLLEEALHGLRDTLLETFPQIETLDITIAKPDILPDCVVSLSL